MSDTTYQRFQHYGTNAQRLAFVPSPAAGIQPIYIWYETDTTKTWLYHTAWVQLTGTGTLPAHAITHKLGGTDVLDVTQLSGFPGGGTRFLRDDGTFAIPAPTRQITFIIDGGGATITTGLKTFVSLPSAGTITKWRILSIDAATTVGSIVLDLWVDHFAFYPPTISDVITASAKPTLSGSNAAESSLLTGWLNTFAAGDIMAVVVNSVTTVSKIMLTVEYV